MVIFFSSHSKSGIVFFLMISALNSSSIWKGSMKNFSYQNINKVPFALSDILLLWEHNLWLWWIKMGGTHVNSTKAKRGPQGLHKSEAWSLGSPVRERLASKNHTHSCKTVILHHISFHRANTFHPSSYVMASFSILECKLPETEALLIYLSLFLSHDR